MQNDYLNENTNVMEMGEEIVMDIRDVLYTLLRRWPLLLVSLLCGTLLFGVFGVYRRQHAAANDAIAVEERISEAQENLSEAQIDEIEGLYTQYKEYTMLQSLLRDQYVEFMRDIDRVDNSYVKTLKFLCTGEDAGPTGIFETQTVLGEEECQEIGKIVAGETNIKKATLLTRNRVLFFVDNNNKLAVSAEEILPVRFVLTVRIIGEYKGQCDQIQRVIERKMLKLQEAYTDAGGVLEMTQFASEYSNDVATSMKDTINTLSGQLRNVTDNLFYLQQNTIDKLDNDAKAYYELLKEQGQATSRSVDGEIDSDSKTTELEEKTWKDYLSKKYMLIGAFAGIFLAAMFILLQYILNHAVQCKESFAALYDIPLHGAVCIKGSRSSGLRMWVYRLLHMSDDLTPERAAAMAQDIGIELEKKDRKSLYILLSDASEELRVFAQTMITNMHTQHPSLSVRSGDPLNDQEQMKVLADSETAILLVGLKKTRRETAAQQLQMCSRYQVPVMGAVTLEVV